MFSKRLKELRESNDLSMDKLVELYNAKYNGKMNKSTLSRYENGLQDPIYTVVVNLAKLFNVSVDYLSGTDIKDYSKKWFSVFDKYIALNDLGKKSADEYIDFLSGKPKYTTAQEPKPLRLHTKQKEHESAPQTFVDDNGEEMVILPVVARGGNNRPVIMTKKAYEEAHKEFADIFDNDDDEEIIPLDED